ncbi:Acyl dehydratase (modular protein) [Frankia canadensis]|uniref:Acyl dehydratase (Modular protein) n=1 Tax=Frankia canadensis TaxID=1836972 RepID=A0A2I2KWS9_9ACTN|nr:MaoC family dehydratase [Frankia canadensis]SNQ50114.1 Acyl dehydratase (modular protein) [Frankia canadensis]SOU57404.1 Acyl dehydratase (modular protein) [Frankia canadensis]
MAGSVTATPPGAGDDPSEAVAGAQAAPSRRVVEQRGLWFDELETDVVYTHGPGRTVGEADNTLFSTLTMNPQALHLDEAWSATQPFGTRLVNSMFTLSTLVGLSVNQLTQGTTVANLGFGEIRFPAPVFHGDTLYAETVVLARRRSRSRPGEGVVTFEHTARNQRGEIVAVAVRSALIRAEPASADTGAAGADGL